MTPYEARKFIHTLLAYIMNEEAPPLSLMIEADQKLKEAWHATWAPEDIGSILVIANERLFVKVSLGIFDVPTDGLSEKSLIQLRHFAEGLPVDEGIIWEFINAYKMQFGFPTTEHEYASRAVAYLHEIAVGKSPERQRFRAAGAIGSITCCRGIRDKKLIDELRDAAECPKVGELLKHMA